MSDNNKVYDLTMLYLEKMNASDLTPEELVETYIATYHRIREAFIKNSQTFTGQTDR